MISLKDFDLDKKVLSIFETHAITQPKEILYTLECYKFVDRSEILSVLGRENPEIKFQDIKVDSFEHTEEFKSIESEYGVFIFREKRGCLGIVYDYFSDVRFESLSLQLGQYDIDFIAVTTFNFDELCGRTDINYDADILFKRILIEAINLKATDLHFTVKHTNLEPSYPIEYRRDGVMVEMDLFKLNSKLNKEIIYKLIERRTDANSLDIAQSSGVIASSEDVFQDGEVELRISANKVKDGFRCVIRIQQKTTVSFTIDQLGFDERVQEDINKLAEKRSGITLITGAIRTGKNTTAFAMANKMIKEPISLISYDSPVEVLMEFPQVDYMEDPDRLLNCVRLAKKQDINVAFLNEIPSRQVAFAVQDLANSSIYVITTMHLDRIWHLPYRLYEYYGDNYKNVISQINGCINQKMFGVVCPHCRRNVLVSTIEDHRKRDLLLNHGVESYFEAVGCEHCRDSLTGSYGFVLGKNQPYVEHLIFSDDLKSRLLACEQAWQMEAIIKEEVKTQKTTLEDYMSKGIKEGNLSIDALNYII